MSARVIIGLLVLGISGTALALLPEGAGDQTDGPRADPDSLYDPIVAGEDFPGGIDWIVSRDGIRPIYEPEFTSANAAQVSEEDLVIGIALDDEVKAYPVGLLAAREMVVDWVGETPILVSWCPLCGTGTVHSRLVDGEPTVFGNQGALWGNAMTWFDHATGSIWSQPLGEAIAGPLEGERLELLPSTLTTWGDWLSSHPSTTILDGPVYRSGTTLDETAIVVSLGGATTAYPLDVVFAQGVVNDVVGEHGVAIVSFPAEGSAWAVFSRGLDSEVVNLQLKGNVLTDAETGSQWDPVTGKALNGELEGESLKRLPASTVFPADFATFWPNGVMYQG